MKRGRKVLFALLAAVILAAACAVTAFADASLKVTLYNAEKGKSYSLYKMFDATVSGDNISYTYPASSTALTTALAGGPFTITPGSPNNYVTLPSDKKEKDIREWLANASVKTALTTALSANLIGTTAASSDTVEWDVTDKGYYLLYRGDAGTPATTVTVTSGNEEIIDKNAKAPNTLKKERTGTGASSSEAAVGDVVDFKVSFVSKHYATVAADGDTKATTEKILKYTITDTPSCMGNLSDLVVKVGTTTLTSDKYSGTPTASGGLVINWTAGGTDAGAFLYDDGAEVIITYKMTVLTAAGPAGKSSNEVDVKYNSTSIPSTDNKVTLNNAKIDVYKTDNSSPAVALKGASFQLIDTATVTSSTKYYTGLDTGLFKAAGDSNIKTFVTGEDGKITGKFVGLSAGTYYLYETAAPSGYIPASAPIKVEITYDESTDKYSMKVAGTAVEGTQATVVNTKAAALPETGGAGTRMLIICGAILFFATSIVLVAKKRQYNEG